MLKNQVIRENAKNGEDIVKKNRNIHLPKIFKGISNKVHISNKKKLQMDVLNTIITVIAGFILFGLWGILLAFIPDIMLIFVISDIWQDNPRDKLIGWKLSIHLYLHSIIFLVMCIIILILTLFMSLGAFLIAIKIIPIFMIHIIIDYLTHSSDYGGHFRGYKKKDYSDVDKPNEKAEVKVID